MRLSVLDGFRGFFLVMMVVIHANEVLKTTAGKLNHHYFGWIEDAQGFIFISGFVVAMVYGRAFDRSGLKAAVRVTYQRIRTIWTYQAGLILLLLLAALFLPEAEGMRGFADYQNSPVLFTLTSLLLLSASMHMGILPMFIYFMLPLPFLFPSIRSGKWPSILAVSLAVWLFGQTRLASVAATGIEDRLAAQNIPIDLGIFFNIFSWQIIFFTGAIVGYHVMRKELSLDFLRSSAGRSLGYVTLWLMIALGIFDRLVYWDLLNPEWTAWFLDTFRRADFSPIHLFAALVALYFVPWVMIAAQHERSSIVRIVDKVITAVVHWKPMVFLGQHSLQVFSFHILLVYFLWYVFGNREVGELPATLILLLSILSLFIPARIHAWWMARKAALKPRHGNAQA